MDLTSHLPRPVSGSEDPPAPIRSTLSGERGNTAPTAAERVLASELEARGEAHDALSMMVSSIARMVQAGRSSDSRWKSS